MKYINKRVEIEAVQFTGRNQSEIATFTNGLCECETYRDIVVLIQPYSRTLVRPTEWVIKTNSNEYSKLTDAEFKAGWIPDEEVKVDDTEDMPVRPRAAILDVNNPRRHRSPNAKRVEK